MDTYYSDAISSLKELRKEQDFKSFIEENDIRKFLNLQKNNIKFENKTDLAYFIIFAQYSGILSKKYNDSTIISFVDRNFTINNNRIDLGKALTKIRKGYKKNENSYKNLNRMIKNFQEDLKK